MTPDNGPPPGCIELDVWGARGSRSLTPASSEIANYTSCYSLNHGEDLFVLDAGRGISIMSHAIETCARFRRTKRVHLFLSHSHMDHWEGLKDSNWFWQKDNELELSIFGPSEAIEALQTGHRHPSYVPLDVLALQTLHALTFTVMGANETLRVRGWTIQSRPLNHYSGAGNTRSHLNTLGFRLRSPAGFTLAYLCDHEPEPDTSATEDSLITGAHVSIVDAHFSDCSQHAYGHGSQEHAAQLALRHPETLVLAAHHSPTATDSDICRAHSKHWNGLQNFCIASEGLVLHWDPERNKVGPPASSDKKTRKSFHNNN